MMFPQLLQVQFFRDGIVNMEVINRVKSQWMTETSLYNCPGTQQTNCTSKHFLTCILVSVEKKQNKAKLWCMYIFYNSKGMLF